MLRRRQTRPSTSDLESRLRAHGRALEIPDPPDIAAGVQQALSGKTARTDRGWLVVRVAAPVVLAAIGAVAAVPSARSAALQLFGLESVRVVSLQRLPATRLRTQEDLGQPVALARARKLVAFRIEYPRGEKPSKLFYASDPPGGRVTLIYGRADRPRLLVTEFLGSRIGPEILKGTAPPVRVIPVSINGAHGIWIGGAHSFAFLDGAARMTRGEQTFLAGRTLVWEQREVTFRIEGTLSRSLAVEIARSFR